MRSRSLLAALGALLALVTGARLSHANDAGAPPGVDGGAGPGPGGPYAVAGGGTKGAILAAPCAAGDPLRCMWAEPLAFDHKEQLPVALDWDTGWIPQSSDLQVRFFVKVPAFTEVKMTSAFQAAWPAAMTLSAEPVRGSGELSFDYGLDVGAQARFQVSVLGQDFGWMGDIPYTPNVAIEAKGDANFTPWAWAPGVSASGQTPSTTLFMVPLTSALVPIPGIEGGVSLDVALSLGVTYQTERVVITPAQSPLTQAHPTAHHAFVEGAWAEYRVRPEGRVKYIGSVHLIPSFYIQILGKKFSIPIVDVPVSVPLTESPFVFNDRLVHVPLPDLRGPEGGPLSAGAVTVGEAALVDVPLSNIGEAKGFFDASIAGQGFSLVGAAPSALSAGAAATLSVRFAPTEPGPATGMLVIKTNDPDTPLLVLSINGEGTAAPATPDAGPPDVGAPDAGTKPPSSGSGDAAAPDAGSGDDLAVDGQPSQVGSCGCREARAGQAPGGVFALGALLAAAAGRRPRRAARRARSPR